MLKIGLPKGLTTALATSGGSGTSVSSGSPDTAHSAACSIHAGVAGSNWESGFASRRYDFVFLIAFCLPP